MRKVLLGFILVVVFAVVGMVLYINSMINTIDREELPKSEEELGITVKQSEETQQEKEEENERVKEPETAKENIVSIALLGLDRNTPDETSRSDSIIIVSIDRKNEKIKVTSLMRDMYVPIPGKGYNRINAAYAFGGPALAVKTINTVFGLDIKNYVSVDFQGLESIIDTIGGVEINVKDYEVPYCYVEAPGLQTLNGMQAVAYSRIRRVGNGDSERTERQRRVLDQLFKKIKAQGITKLPDILKAVLPYVETSLSNEDIIYLASGMIRLNTNSLEQLRIPVEGYDSSRRINGKAVLVPDIDKNSKKIHEFIYGIN